MARTKIRKLFLAVTLLLSFCTLVLSGSEEKKYFLTACAMIKNEMKVLLEWIEFHRIQGVERFFFVEDESSDDVYLLPRLYESLGYPDLVEIIPQNFRRRSRPGDHSYTDHDQGQWQALNHCNSRMRGVSEWMLVCDVDEFMFSPQHHTIAAFLRSQTDKEISQFGAKVIRFGTSGVQNENRVRLLLDPFEDQIVVANDVLNGDILLTSRNSRRAPFPDADKDFQQHFDRICGSTKNAIDCQHAIGKSIWRPDKCGMAGVHYCGADLVGKTVYPPLEGLRINHYAFRSREHMENQPKNQMGAIKGAAYRYFDAAWFSFLEDNTTVPYRQELLDRLDAFPTATIHHTKLTNFDWNSSDSRWGNSTSDSLFDFANPESPDQIAYRIAFYVICIFLLWWMVSFVKAL